MERINMRKTWITLSIITVLVIVVGLILWGPIVSNVEQPGYQVLLSEGKIEVRKYNPMIVAEVFVKGDRKDAINQGFRLLADYIFGNNINNGNISMTAPVTQQQSQKIAMTAPVSQHSKGNGWAVQFIMPSEYSMDTLPKPINEEVILKTVPSRTFVVYQFSGLNTNENILLHENKLKAYLSTKDMKVLSAPVYAFYNPPWTLPFLRRNEVLIEIEE